MKNKYFNFLSIIISTVILTIAGTFWLHVVIAWDGPTENPPEGNVPAPLNIGSADQYKSGELELQGGLKVHSTSQATTNIWTDANGLRIDARNDADTNLLITESYIYIGGSIMDLFDTIVNIGEDLTVNGEVRANAFYYTSDRTLKENIQPISNSLEKILQLEGVSFDWKDTGKESIGLISQDVENTFPEIVSADENGIKSLEYAKLVAPLIEAIKEQQKQIDELRVEIEKLK